MSLSSDLISQFVKITNDNRNDTKKDTVVYGTIKIQTNENGTSTQYVQLDGSEVYTPISTTTNASDGDRVTAMIKNHAIVITGNLSAPSATVDDLDGTNGKITEFENVLAESVTTGEFQAQVARIDGLVANDVAIGNQLSANEAAISELQTDNVTINESLTAAQADIDNLSTEKIDTITANATFATIKDLEAANATIYNLESTYADFKILTTDQIAAIDASIDELEANKLSAKDIEGKYANIDFSNISKATMEWFYANSGLIENVTVGDGYITGNLVGVTFKGDLIEGNTVVADKLVIQGEDGLYYKLNTDGVTTEAEQTEYNSLDGKVITAKSITATKISVDDLVAFDATIGGFNITDSSLYSGVKETVDNTTRGVYLDSDGQAAIGDASNYIKYYKDTDGTYKLAISAASIIFATSNKSVEEELETIQSTVDDIEVGGRNLLLGSATKQISPYLETSATTEYGVEVTEWLTTEATRTYGTGGTSTIFGTMGGTSWHGAASEDQMYSASIYVKNNHSTNTVTISGNHLAGLYVDVAPLETKRVELVGAGNGWGYLQFNFKTAAAGDEFDITYWHPKIEFGNKPTDWTPAPEDMATADDLGVVENLAETANTKADTANSLVQQLSDSISMLVTDGNGTSLMTQTEDGWTFSTADIQTAINSTSEGLDALTNELGDTNSAVDVLQQAVDDLGAIAEYVKIGTYEDEPCIELGEGDSDFKLLITNTRIMFMEGSSVVAYINNQSLHVKKAVIEEEMQQGGFIWKVRANGNMGLVWKGVSS